MVDSDYPSLWQQKEESPINLRKTSTFEMPPSLLERVFSTSWDGYIKAGTLRTFLMFKKLKRVHSLQKGILFRMDVVGIVTILPYWEAF